MAEKTRIQLECTYCPAYWVFCFGYDMLLLSFCSLPVELNCNAIRVIVTTDIGEMRRIRYTTEEIISGITQSTLTTRSSYHFQLSQRILRLASIKYLYVSILYPTCDRVGYKKYCGSWIRINNCLRVSTARTFSNTYTCVPCLLHRRDVDFTYTSLFSLFTRILTVNVT